MLVVVGISSYAAETTWKSQPTTAAEYDAVFDYTSYTSTTDCPYNMDRYI